MVWGPGGLGGARWCLGFKDKDTEDIPLNKSHFFSFSGNPLGESKTESGPQEHQLNPWLKDCTSNLDAPLLQTKRRGLNPHFFVLILFRSFFFRSRGFVVFFGDSCVFFNLNGVSNL